MAVKLGDVVTDRITGLTGTATGCAEYLYGCRQIQITPRSPQESAWIDEQRLTIDPAATSGGPQHHPPDRPHPS